MQVGEGSDAQTVAGVKLRLQELAANLTDVHQLEEAGSWKQHLEIKRLKILISRFQFRAVHVHATHNTKCNTASRKTNIYCLQIVQFECLNSSRMQN